MEALFRDQAGDVLESISSDLERVEKIMADSATGIGEVFGEFTTHLARAGGKRIRPALTLLASQLGEGPNQNVDYTAAAAELTHLATLYHDDVIDEAATRRGVSSANQKWGNKVAILAGDYLFAKASSLAANVGGIVPDVLATAIAKVVAGQLTELQSTYDPNRSEEHYFETIDGKTVSLMETCTLFGAVLGECPTKVIDAMTTFGRSLGFAFQIADDLLDIAASPETLGKAPGTDLRDGVYTLPVIYAVAADAAVAELLSAPDVDVDAVRAATVATGSFAKAMSRAQIYLDEALNALETVPDCAARPTLENLARSVVARVPRLS